ncbi:MAG: carbamoyltransferase C-terminal domain-containing protein [Candidatus Tritonobacter lacicola]|nr:carbamoyltransferase C-terminal domain-containing protein [Candidatus Tritonobacter lacicola]
MITIGINEGINSSVAVAENGKILFAIQEERITRIKNFMGFPHESLDFALKYLGLSPSDVDSVCFSNLVSPITSKEAFYALYDAAEEVDSPGATEGDIKKAAKKFYDVLPENVKKFVRERVLNVDPERIMLDCLKKHGLQKARVVRKHHHLNHAAAVYYGLRKEHDEPYLVMTLDGAGDDACSHIYIGQGGKLKLIAATPNGHSIGNIWAHVTHHMGMTPHEHEYKLMGLAAYSKPEYSAKVFEIFKSYLDLDPANPLVFKSRIPEGSFAVQKHLERDLKRIRFDNIAGGLQSYTEDLLLRWTKAAIEKTGIRKLLVSGGVFMNVKANALISRLDEVEYFDVFPSCGDESLPFGAVWAYYAESSPDGAKNIRLEDFYLGPDSNYDLQEALKKFEGKLNFYRLDHPEKATAKLLAMGKIVARCSGRMEFGARALGNRSILADPSDYTVIPTINKMVKKRDFWMPFAPAILREDAEKYIEVPASLPEDHVSPYMMITFNTTGRRDEFVAGTHNYDGTARAQIVLKEMNPRFHEIIAEFSKHTDKAVVLNTSFNLHGYPIVMGSLDAIDVMLNSAIEYLLLNDYLVTKEPVADIKELDQ